jgi:hypothetical protein
MRVVASVAGIGYHPEGDERPSDQRSAIEVSFGECSFPVVSG